MRITIIYQINYTTIILRSYHPTRRLHYFLHTRIEICVLVSKSEDVFHALSHLLVDFIYLWQSYCRYERADETISRQVNAFAK